MTHWADVLAADLLKRGQRHLLATAITPSGPIHVGNMREVLTTEAVFRAVKDAGGEAELIYIGDTYDPLRKVYPFLPAWYEAHVGKPLCDIPCPCGAHKSYADHYLQPFLAALADVGVYPRVLLAHEMYRNGMYVEATRKAMDATETIREIMVRVAGREGKLPPNWIPFNIQCEQCGRLKGPIPTLYEDPIIEYRCEACGHEGEKDVTKPGGGKLPWRVDWPARWSFLNVTFEAMGKDHAAAGSSWDTGIEIVDKVYDHAPPLRTVYEFVQVKGVGAMHSSAGTAVAATDMLQMTPPEVLRYLFMRPQPGKHIDFETGQWIVDLVEGYDRVLADYYAEGAPAPSRADASGRPALHPSKEAVGAAEQGAAARSPLERRLGVDAADAARILELSQPKGHLPSKAPPHVPYSHLVFLLQISPSWSDLTDRLQRSEIVPGALTKEEIDHLHVRAEHARFWLTTYAPPEAKIAIAQGLTSEAAAALTDAQRRFLKTLGAKLEGCKWTAATIHDCIHETARADNIPAAEAFGAIYWLFLGRAKGPRAGYFLASLDRAQVLQQVRALGSLA
ncbi:MAG: lysine--tRNA ligase [Thermoplasmatota archaeon]